MTLTASRWRTADICAGQNRLVSVAIPMGGVFAALAAGAAV